MGAAGEDEAAGRGQHRAPVLRLGELVGPDLLAGREVPRLQLAEMVGAVHHEDLGRSAGEPLAGDVLDFAADDGRAQVLVGGHVEVAGLRAVGGRGPVFAAPQRGAEGRRPVGAGLALRVVLGPAGHRVDGREHVLVHVGLGVDEGDGVRTALEQPQIAVPGRVHQGRDGAPVARDVDQQRGRDLVPVPRAVPVILVVALQFAGVGVEGDDRVGVQVVAGALVADPGAGVAGPPVGEVELGVERAGDPDGGAAGAPRVARPRLVAGLAGAGDGVRPPHLLARLGVVGGHEPPDAPFAARRADEHLAVGDEGRHGHVVARAVVGDGRLPDEFAGHRVERDHERVVGRVVDLVAVEADPAVGPVGMAHVLGELPLVQPELVARAGVHRDDPIFRGGDEHDAVVDDRRRLVARRDAGRQRPHRFQAGHVLGRDLVQRAVAPAVVGAAVHQPVAVGGRPQPLVGDRRVGRFLRRRRRNRRPEGRDRRARANQPQR